MALYSVQDPTAWLHDQVNKTDEGTEQLRKGDIATLFRYYEDGTGKELNPIALPGGRGFEPDDNLSAKLFKMSIDSGRRSAIKNGRKIISIAKKAQNDNFQRWARKRFLARFLKEMFTSGAIGGHAFMMFGRHDDGEPVVWLWDPQNVSVIYDPDDYTRVIAYVNEWQPEDNSGHRRTVVWREIEGHGIGHKKLTDIWHVDDYIASNVSDGNNKLWIPLMGDDDTVWEYDWCPVIDCPNLSEPHQYYGAPDIDFQDIQLIRGFNRNLSHANRMSRAYASPLRYAYGISALGSGGGTGQSTEGADRLADWEGYNDNQQEFLRSSGNAGAQQAEAATRLNNGDVILLDDEKGFVKALQASGDQDGILSLIKFIRELYMQQTGTLLMSPELFDHLRELNGKAFKAFYGPVADKVDDKILNYEPVLDELAMRVMEMLGDPIEQQDVVYSWPSVVPVNEAEELTNAEKEQALGVSQTTTLTKLGRDPILERKLRLMEAQHQAQIAKLMAEANASGLTEGNEDDEEDDGDEA